MDRSRCVGVAAIISAVVWRIRQTGGMRDSGSGGPPSAAEILDRRFAGAAISAEEYREGRETLSETER
jgi:uncharacterized membrane protein